MATILVLDDVLDAVILIKRILSRKGHGVITFTEEEEAIAYAGSHDVDLAILDIKLKRLSGLEVLERLKKIDPGIRVLMLTGYPSLETAKEAMDLGAGAYCVKPIDMDELEDKVAGLLQQA